MRMNSHRIADINATQRNTIYYSHEFGLRVGFHEPELLLRLRPETFRGVGFMLGEPGLRCEEELTGSGVRRSQASEEEAVPSP